MGKWPGTYNWHNSSVKHYHEDLAAPQLPGFAKAEATSQLAQFAVPFGTLGTSANLQHYDYFNKGPAIDKLVHDYGYLPSYYGSRYGQPDLANKNYDTGHLHLPEPEADDEHGQRTSYQKLHELAHALTLPEINKIYGDGKRVGVLGTHLSLNDSLRAVHWEHLAAHKQRELSSQVGSNIKDDAFNRELNTSLLDAIHKVATGVTADPYAEGFTPHSHKIPLHMALQTVRNLANRQEEPAHTIFEKTEGDFPVADDKKYTPNEAGTLLMKFAKEKVDAFAKEMETLRTRELKKAIIPAHAHDKGITAGSDTEDIPPGKINPKGKDDDLGKEELCKECGEKHDLTKGCMAKSVDKMIVHGSKKVAPATKAADYKITQTKNQTTFTKKSELVDAKGNRSSNDVVDGSVLPGDKKSKVVKTPGSGGSILPGAHLFKKSELAKAEDHPQCPDCKGKIPSNGKGGHVPHSVPGTNGMFSCSPKGAKNNYAGVDHAKAELEKAKISEHDGVDISSMSSSDLGRRADARMAAARKEKDTLATKLRQPLISAKAELEKAGPAVPMAKPPSGGAPGTPPMAKPPKAPSMAQPALKGELEKVALAGVKGAVVDASAKAHAGAPKKEPGTIHSPAQAASRHAELAAFTPSATPAVSKPALPKPAAPKVPGLASPQSAKSAGPVVNAARPAPSAKPGIFGRLSNKIKGL